MQLPVSKNLNGEGRSFVRLVENIIEAVARLSGTGVCIYDLKNAFSNGCEGPIKRDLKGHYCAFCQMVRNLPGGRELCIQSDVVDAVRHSQEYTQPFFHTCHAGITELVVPIIYKDKVAATVFIGQCRIEGETRFETVVSKLQSSGGTRQLLAQYFDSLPLVNRSTLLAAGTLTDLSFRYFMQNEGKSALDEYFKADREDYVTRGTKFIEDHYIEGIAAKDVIDYVHLNPSYYARLFKKYTGKSVTDYIHCVRVERAKSLLIKTNISINSIALNVGYCDQNYFTRMFSRHEGVSPCEFRRNKSNTTIRYT